LAVKFKPQILQQWLFNFGYGRNILPPPFAINDTPLKRNHRQLHGSISQKQLSTRIEVTDYNQVPMLDDREPRWFGIGQGNLRVTPLHVANSMAMLARGAYKPPKLYIEEQNHDPNYNAPIRISDETLSVVYDGMRAVINEPGGTAYEEFRNSGLDEKEIDIYGKTGSTENPDNAWFAGFAKDSDSRSIAISVIVEGGQHGSSDAAPLGREIMKICNELGYIGK
jgi:cell division protein FtsI/penicillin-binding protein 2